ncbi:heavy-metal-associated domain-containing protein [Streptomyces sp. NPDC060194]|uniref:heavy-metal-associated domain-containing protein n=1 Tax=Streptomyces sp. NPDC060194 TaxID=3347069 RepID=UPI00365B8A69
MTAPTELPQAASGCCGGSGACAPEAAAGSVTAVYEVKGMTCGHCEGAVAGELSELPGVASVQAAAATGRVTVVSAAPLDEDAVRAAVDEAGYELVGTV